MNKKRKLGALLLSGLLVLSPSAFADAAGAPHPFGCLPRASMAQPRRSAATTPLKEEVVYGKLATDGSVQNLYVVNEFHLSESTQVLDYGLYDQVKNLTSTETLTQSGDMVTFPADRGTFFYQGTLQSKDLPWLFAFQDQLNGKPVSSEALAGAQGAWELHFSVKPNPAVDEVFYKHFALQITVTLNNEKAQDIRAPKATIANAGKNKVLTYTLLPGKEAEYTLSAAIKDFEMPDIQISAVPYALPLDLPDSNQVTEEMAPLTGATGSLADGAAALADGATQLADGIDRLKLGSGTFSEGLSKLNDSGSSLSDGSTQIRDALKKTAESLQTSLSPGALELPDLSALQALPAQLRQFSTALSAIEDGLSTLQSGLSAQLAPLDAALSAIPPSGLTDVQIGALLNLLAASSDPAAAEALQTAQELVSNWQAAQVARGTYLTPNQSGVSIQQGLQGIVGGLDTILHGDGTADNPGLHGLSVGMEQMAQAMEEQMAAIAQSDPQASLQTLQDGLKQLTDGLQKLSSEYTTFDEGLQKYTQGVGELTGGYGQVDGGIVDLQGGARSLADGAAKLHDGTVTLNNGVAQLPEEIRSRMDEMMADFTIGDFTPRSFVSPHNENVKRVQFVLLRDGVKKPEPPAPQEEKAAEKSAWDRFLDLFR